MSKKKPHYRKSALVFEELEARLLLSADPLAVATEAGAATVQELVLGNNEDHTAIVQSTTEQSVSSVRNELVIIDSRAPNYQQLHNDLVKAQQQGRNIHVVVLDAHRDGIDQISEALASYDKLDAVHIVSHGDDGQLQLGSTQLNKTTLRDHAADISQWKGGFTDGGDLLIYGCNLAGTAEGKSMVDALSYLTATDVAASDDVTGNKLLGGDWDLEYEAGGIETSVAFSDEIQQQWHGTLEGGAQAADSDTTANEEQQEQQQAQIQLEQQQAALKDSEQTDVKQEEAEQQAAIAEQQRQEVVFVDESVGDYLSFIDDLQVNSDQSTMFEIVLLDGDRSGIDQINETLSAYDNVDALHLVTHGSDGAVKLGNSWLNTDNLENHSDKLSAWSSSLDQDADILIYGCNLAETSEGQNFVAELAQITATDIAVSTDITGHALFGGDWDLEYKVGIVETNVPFSENLQQDYIAILGTETVEDDLSSGDFTGNKGSQNWIGDWIEVDAGGAGAGVGNVVVTGEEIRISSVGSSVARETDLSAATSATLRFDYHTGSGVESSDPDSIIVEISNNGGSTWTTLEDINYLDGVNSDTLSYDISAYMAVDTQVRFRVNNGYDAADEFFYIDDVRIQYTTGTAPVITSNGGGATAGLNVAENTPAVTTVTTTHADGDPITYTIAGGDDAALFNIDLNSGALTFVSAPDFENPADANTDNVYEVIVQAEDADGDTDTQAISVTVTNELELTVTSTSATGTGSLHQAILDSNANVGVTDTITFNIAGAGPHVISLAGPLPIITDTIIIDGTTEPDFSYAGDGSPRPVVVIDGTAAGAVNGIVLGAGSGGSAIRGLVVQNFQNDGILVQSDNNTIAANILGLQTDGVTIAGNNLVGTGLHGNIRIESANNTVGGLNPADRNIISGSGFSGIVLFGAGATGNQIQGNFIGTDISGTLAKGNAQEGIEIQDASGNTIGGTTAGARNIISANGSDGMEIDNGDNNIIQGNYIGTDVTGSVALGNVRDGIDINENVGDGSTGNLIGGTDPNAANLISGNGMFGIEVRDAPTVSNTILGNSIYGNGLIGIQLSTDGVVTLNDAGDADADSNNLQNFPVLTTADTNTVDTIVIDGTLNSTANSYFRIEYFASSAGDGTGYGEGETYLGYVNVATDGSGNASFSASLSAAVANGAVISATATKSDATYTTFTDTSEFAANIIAAANYPAGATDDPQAFSAYLTSLGPTGYWRLGEGAGGTAVDSTGLNDGTYNGLTLGQSGALSADGDTALLFDGVDDYMELSHDPAYLLDDGTVQFWFKTADVTQRADLFSKDALGNVTGGHLSIYLDGAGNIETRLQSASASYLTTSTLPLVNNQWHHVAFTFGAGGMQFYVDGQLQDSDAYTGGLGTTSGGAGNFEPIAIGASTQVSNTGLVTPLQDYFSGHMDELALFGTVLTADQIQNLYAGGLQNYTIAEDTTLNVAATEGVLINDYDQEGDLLTAVLVSGPSNAAAFTLYNDGSFDYTPVTNFNGTDTFSYRAHDGTSTSNVATVTITVTAENDAPVDLQVTSTIQGGTSLNEDGGNDVYFVADDGAGLLGGLTTVTIESSFSVTTPGADLTPLLSYADGANDEELALFLKSDGRIWFGVHSNGSPIQSTTGTYTQLFDGEVHHVGASWDSSTGAVVFYVDGQLVESFSGYQTGQTITGSGELVFGQDQDSVLGGFKTIDVFSGTLYDVRIFDDVRTPAEIAASYDQTLPNSEPGMIANWMFNDLSTGGIVMDTVGGNNLTEQHVVGVGFSSSTPELTLAVKEDAADGVVIGSISAIDPDIGDTFNYTLLDDAGGRFAINAADGQLTLANASLINYETAVSHNITVRVTDSGALTYDEVFTVYVVNVNEAPLNTVPGTQIVLEDTQTAIAGISVADVDAGVNVITTQLSVSNGVLDITLAGAATISAGANGSNTLTISGSVADINASLVSLKYTGNPNVYGIAADTLTIVTNDLGNTGTGGALNDTDNVQIDITAVNDIPAARDDRIGLVFDGVDDYVTIGGYPGLNVSTNLTMEAWIKPTGLGTGSKIIINKEGEYELGITADTGEVKWAFDNIDPDWSWHNTGYFVQAGEWTHLAVTYNNGVVETFANGVLVDTYNGSGAITDNYPVFNQLQIGGRENAVTQRFDGQIDEVRIWNSTRTQLEIQTNINTLLTGTEPGLIGNWRFDEGSSITVEDQSVFGHHGTLADGINATEMPAWQGYVVSEEGTLNVSAVNGVLANDFDIDGDTLTAVLVSGPVNAAAFSLNSDGSFTYTPTANFNGVDTFSYRANDGSVDSNIAIVTIRVDPVNDVPVAMANTVTTTEDNAYTFSSTDFTFSDVEGDSLISTTITNLSLAGGTLTHSGGTTVNNGDTLTAAQLDTLVYAPATGANGTPLATFDFSVNDAGAGVASAQMSINVTAVNDVPVAIASTVSTTEDNAYSFSIVDFTYFDTEGDALVSATITNLSLAGGTLTHSSGTTVNGGDTLTAAELNTLVYTPPANTTGSPLASFDFTVNDSGAGVVAAQMSVNVTAVNDVPVAIASTVSTMEDNAYSFSSVDFTYFDTEGDALVSATITNLSLAGGTLTHSGGTTVNGGDTLTAAELNTLVYTPPANTTGSPLASFDFTVNDSGAGVVAAQMSVNVTAVNDVPVAIASTVSTTEDNAYTFSSVDFTYFDTEGDPLVSATITNLSLGGGTLIHSGGTIVNNGDTLTAAQLNTLEYTPVSNANGTPLATFDFTVNDAGLGVSSAQMSINVMPQPDAAIIGGVDSGAVTEDDDPDTNNLLEVSGALSIIDPDAGEAMFNAGVIGGTYGVITLNAAGNWDYAAINNQPAIQNLAAGATLTDTITISSVDGTTHDIVITIMGTNDAPVAGNDVASVNEGGSVLIAVAASDNDIDNALDLNSIIITGLPANGSVVVNGDGTVTYTHDGSETLADSFIYTISDVSGAVSNTATVTLTINPVNDPPLASNDTATVTEGNTVVIDLAANDSDVDNALDLNSIVITGAPVNGSIIVNGDGTVDYTHDGSETTSDSFTYTINDVSGAISNTATVTITVTPVNDAPTTTGIADVNVNEDAASTGIDLNAAFADADNLDSELTYAIVGNNNIGLFSLAGVDNTTGQLTLDYATDMNGLSQISVRATDPSGSFVDTLFSVTVNAVNDNPVLQANTGMQAADAAPVTISNTELNVTDVDNPDTELVYTVTSLPANGELRLNGAVMALNGTFTQADLDSNLLMYVPTGAVTADQFGFTVSDNAGGAIANNTFNILVQVSQDNDDDTVSEPSPKDSIEEEDTTEEESGETESGGLMEGAGGYGGGFEPLGSSSVPPPAPAPVLTIDPQPEPVREQVQPVEQEEHETVEVEQHEVSTFAAVQVKSIDALWSAIDKMKQEMAEAEEGVTTPVEFQAAAAKSTGVVLTAGVVAWILRSGALLSSLLSTIPLWKGYDPLPILAYKDDKDKNREEVIDEHAIPTSLEDLRKLKQLMQQKQKAANQVDVDSMFGGSTIRDQ